MEWLPSVLLDNMIFSVFAGNVGSWAAATIQASSEFESTQANKVGQEGPEYADATNPMMCNKPDPNRVAGFYYPSLLVVLFAFVMVACNMRKHKFGTIGFVVVSCDMPKYRWYKAIVAALGIWSIFVFFVGFVMVASSDSTQKGAAFRVHVVQLITLLGFVKSDMYAPISCKIPISADAYKCTLPKMRFWHPHQKVLESLEDALLELASKKIGGNLDLTDKDLACNKDLGMSQEDVKTLMESLGKEHVEAQK